MGNLLQLFIWKSIVGIYLLLLLIMNTYPKHNFTCRGEFYGIPYKICYDLSQPARIAS